MADPEVDHDAESGWAAMGPALDVYRYVRDLGEHLRRMLHEATSTTLPMAASDLPGKRDKSGRARPVQPSRGP
jgi:hypothetical protein